MSNFFCPNASRPLLRLAVRGFAPRTPTTQLASTRWLSCSAAHNLSTPLSRQIQRPTSRPRSPVFSPGSSHHYGDRRTFFGPKTIRHYEELPKDYRDQTGLSFKGRDLVDAEVTRIFGPGMKSEAANHLLRILHGRRVAGTLDDPAFAVHTAQFSKAQQEKALEYLRKTVPLNEVMNAGLRAEDELAQLEEEGKKKQRAAAAKSEETDAEQGEPYKEDPIYGRSQFDQIRAKNIAKRKAEEKALEEERLAAEAQGHTTGPLAKTRSKERAIVDPRLQAYYDKGQSDLEAPPERTPWERILPSATAVLLVLGILAALCSVYEEPLPRYRLIPDVTTSQATVGALIVANLLILAAWRLPPLWRALNKSFIMVVATPNPAAMFLAMFSHQKLSHFMLNMVPLWYVGTAMHDELGRADFLTLYTACGALAFVGSLATYTLRGLLMVTTLGASGGVLGLVSAFFWEHRNDGFRFFGLPKDGVHGIVGLAAILALQLTMWGKTKSLKVDVTSHIVAIMAGVVGIEVVNRLRGRNPGDRKKMVYNVVDMPEGKTKKPAIKVPTQGEKGNQ